MNTKPSALPLDSSQGLVFTCAIGAHNIPEGMAVATVLVQKGASPGRAFWWAMLSSFPQACAAPLPFVHPRAAHGISYCGYLHYNLH